MASAASSSYVSPFFTRASGVISIVGSLPFLYSSGRNRSEGSSPVDSIGGAVVDQAATSEPVEVKHLRRYDVDLVKRFVHVRRSKNETSHRVIPLNASAIEAAARMFERADVARAHRARALPLAGVPV